MTCIWKNKISDIHLALNRVMDVHAGKNPKFKDLWDKDRFRFHISIQGIITVKCMIPKVEAKQEYDWKGRPLPLRFNASSSEPLTWKDQVDLSHIMLHDKLWDEAQSWLISRAIYVVDYLDDLRSISGVMDS